MAAPASHFPVLFALAGPAGSGKSTLCERLVADAPAFSRVVTATTRAPREGEIDGVHYHFLTPAQFDAKLAGGEFLEWAWVHQTQRYGTLLASVLEPLARGRSLIINIDVQGVENFRRAAAAQPLLRRHLASIFIIPETLAELRARLVSRGKDGPEEIARRLRTAEQELREVGNFDYQIRSRSKEEDYQALLKIWHDAQTRLAAQG